MRACKNRHEEARKINLICKFKNQAKFNIEIYKKFVQFDSDCAIISELSGEWPVNFDHGMWLSLVERFVRDEEVACSNHVIPI